MSARPGAIKNMLHNKNEIVTRGRLLNHAMLFEPCENELRDLSFVGSRIKKQEGICFCGMTLHLHR